MESAGVNRLSLGAQSMRAETLSRLGRDHSPQQVREAMEWSRLVGIERVNIDLMHGLKGDGKSEALMIGGGITFITEATSRSISSQ